MSTVYPSRVLRLRRLVRAYQDRTGHTQHEIARAVGWTQGALSQYLNAITRLNDSALVKLANFLGIDPAEIDEDYDVRAPQYMRLGRAHSIAGLLSPPVDEWYLNRYDQVESLLLWADVPIYAVGRSGPELFAREGWFVEVCPVSESDRDDEWYAYRTGAGWGFYLQGCSEPLGAVDEHRWIVSALRQHI